jgi:HSP20 family protein
MTIVRWEPLGSLENMLTRTPNFRAQWPRLSEGRGGCRYDWSPSVDISETDAEYLVRAELPAVNKEDVHITFDNSVLTISGERRQKVDEENERFHRVENSYGSFSRRFSLPENVDAAAIRAASKDGIVTVHVPKTTTDAKKAAEIKIP